MATPIDENADCLTAAVWCTEAWMLQRKTKKNKWILETRHEDRQ